MTALPIVVFGSGFAVGWLARRGGAGMIGSIMIGVFTSGIMTAAIGMAFRLIERL